MECLPRLYIDGANCNTQYLNHSIRIDLSQVCIDPIKNRAPTAEKSEPTAETGIDVMPWRSVNVGSQAQASLVSRELSLFLGNCSFLVRSHAGLKVCPIYMRPLSARTTPIALIPNPLFKCLVARHAALLLTRTHTICLHVFLGEQSTGWMPIYLYIYGLEESLRMHTIDGLRVAKTHVGATSPSALGTNDAVYELPPKPATKGPP